MDPFSLKKPWNSIFFEFQGLFFCLLSRYLYTKIQGEHSSISLIFSNKTQGNPLFTRSWVRVTAFLDLRIHSVGEPRDLTSFIETIPSSRSSSHHLFERITPKNRSAFPPLQSMYSPKIHTFFVSTEINTALGVYP